MIINNVKLVLDDEVVHGSLEVHDGRILAFAESQSRLPQALDGGRRLAAAGPYRSCIPITSTSSLPRGRR
ncbi:metal-dependent hydrolase [Klebsiella pneumoniae]|uniref:Metal-dependent hydrolase n=1 Tax=Klebsiella pneumoniae TaxID=573 RepID=A0A3S4GPA1_KLEPN|nr:metal-dependent hydrolase [Klebsiella pneumoniae]